MIPSLYMESKLIPAAAAASYASTASMEGAGVEVASRAGADAALLEDTGGVNDNVSIVAAADAVPIAVAFVRDFMLSDSDEWVVITGFMDTVS